MPDTQVRFLFRFTSIDFANRVINEDLKQLQKTSLRHQLSIKDSNRKDKKLAEVLSRIEQ